MLPIRDRIPTRRFPIITLLLIVINVAVFGYELSLQSAGGNALMNQFITSYGLVPARVTGQPGAATWLTFVTSMFLHGSVLHIAGNMLYLWIFGNNVEDVLGHFWYAIFYFVCGFAASFAQILMSWGSQVPGIGASGAIAGVLAAYLIYFPRAQVETLIFFGIFVTIRAIPAIIVLGLWFLLQLFSGFLVLGNVQTSGVAYYAHIGGFLAGLILALPWLPGVRRRYARS